MKLFKTLTLAAMACILTGASPAIAEYPEKPVEFIVPWPPGDLEDVLARMLAEDFSTKYGVPAAVVNKPGGGGGPFPGAIETASRPADGYSVGVFVMDIPLVGPFVGIPELDPDPFEAIGVFVTYPFVLASSKEAPYSTLQELAEHAKNNKVTLAHFGPQAAPTQVTFALAKQMGFSYGGDSAFDVVDCNTFASGDADVANTTLQLVLPCLDKLNVLVSFTDERISLAPDAPTLAEVAPNIALTTWSGLFVHKDTPADVRAKIASVAKMTMASDRAQALAKRTGGFVYWENSDESAAHITKDKDTLGRVQKINGQ